MPYRTPSRPLGLRAGIDLTKALSVANLLIYALDETSPYHRRAKEWLDTELSSGETFPFTWPVLLAVIRLTTNGRIFEHPLTGSDALDVVDAWLAQPTATLIGPTERQVGLLRELLESSGTAGNLTSDAHLAAVCIEHGHAVLGRSGLRPVERPALGQPARRRTANGGASELGPIQKALTRRPALPDGGVRCGRRPGDRRRGRRRPGGTSRSRPGSGRR